MLLFPANIALPLFFPCICLDLVVCSKVQSQVWSEYIWEFFQEATFVSRWGVVVTLISINFLAPSVKTCFDFTKPLLQSLFVHETKHTAGKQAKTEQQCAVVHNSLLPPTPAPKLILWQFKHVKKKSVHLGNDELHNKINQVKNTIG